MFTLDAEQNRLRLHCDLTIFQVGQLWPALKDSLAQVQEIDLVEVNEFDTAGVQLLLMLKRAAAEQQQPLHLVNHSVAITDLLGLINVGGMLGDPVVLPSERSTG